MTINLAVSNIMDYVFTSIIVAVVRSITDNDTVRRLPPLLALIISLLIIKSAAKQERNSA
jgi:hypothetical protein